MIEIKISFPKDFYKSIDEIRNLFKEAPNNVRDAFSDWLTLDLDPAIQIQLAGKALRRRTGRMASNYELTRPIVTAHRVAAYLMHREPQAAIQEVGGLIQARTGSWLTIPLKAALTGTGALRAPARQWSNTFFQKSKKGNLILFQTKGSKIIPLFVLKKSVRLKATHWLSGAVKQTEESLFQRIEAELGE